MGRIALDLVVFIMLVPGLGLVLAPEGARSPAERFCIGLAAALLAIYLASFALYVTGAPPAATGMIPAAILVVAICRRKQAARLLNNRELRELLGHWGLFILWTLGLLALIVSFSGAQWTGDCWEHFERSRFFLEHLPKNTAFLNHYPLTARPPLANIVTATLMALSGRVFPDYQIHTALLATLIFLPGWLFFRRWGGTRYGLWTLILILNPLVAQNTTFGWTKMPTAFLVLTAGHFLLEGFRNPQDTAARIIAFICLTAAVITHYSACIWLVIWATAYGAWCLRSAAKGLLLREITLILAICVSLGLTWFGWAMGNYGWKETGAANTTAAYWDLQTPAQSVSTMAENVLNTVVPHPLRNIDRSGIAQTAALSYVRDYWFNIYQLSLPLSVGFSGLAVLMLGVMCPHKKQPGIRAAGSRPFWWWTIPAAILLGVAVVTMPDRWGVTHISLQPLVLLALAWIASLLESMPRRLICVFAALITIDFVLGTVLHFFIQALAMPAWWAGTADEALAAAALNPMAKTNYYYALHFNYSTLGSDPAVSSVLVTSVLAAVLALVLAGLRSGPTVKIDALPQP